MAIADALSRTPAQVLLRWSIQRNVSVVPKSSTPSRIKSNADILTWCLSDDEMYLLNSLDRHYRFVNVTWLVRYTLYIHTLPSIYTLYTLSPLYIHYTHSPLYIYTIHTLPSIYTIHRFDFDLYDSRIDQIDELSKVAHPELLNQPLLKTGEVNHYTLYTIHYTLYTIQ